MRQGKLCRRGAMLINRPLLLMIFSCAGAVMSAAVPAQKSAGSVTPDHQLEAPLGQSDASATPGNVLEVPLGQSAVLSCHPQLPPGVLKDSCIYVQTKDTRKKNPPPMFLTGPEVEVEETEKLLLYWRRGQEETEHQSSLYQNRTHYLGGEDVRVELRNVSVSDNNTIFQCVVCPHCRNCEPQTEITLRTEKRTDDEGGNGNPTVPVAVPVAVPVSVLVLVVVAIVIVVCLVRKKQANQSSQNATEGGTMGAVENGVVDRTTEREGNQNQPDGSLVMTQLNGPVMVTTDQLNGPVMVTTDQLNGPVMKNQQQQLQQSGSAESALAPELEPLLRNGHSRGKEEYGHSRGEEEYGHSRGEARGTRTEPWVNSTEPWVNRTEPWETSL